MKTDKLGRELMVGDVVICYYKNGYIQGVIYGFKEVQQRYFNPRVQAMIVANNYDDIRLTFSNYSKILLIDTTRLSSKISKLLQLKNIVENEIFRNGPVYQDNNLVNQRRKRQFLQTVKEQYNNVSEMQS